MSLLYKVEGNSITPLEGLNWETYRHFREMIMDGKLPIKKPIGFKIESVTGMNIASAVHRNALCAESMATIATAVKELIFVGDMNSWVKSDQHEGAVTSNLRLTSKDGKPVTVVNKDLYLYTAVEEVCLSFFVLKAAGFQSMKENAKYMEDRVSNGAIAFFPMHTYHTLGNHVFVYPYTKGDTTIRVRYANGMTSELFSKIIEEAYEDAY